MIFDYNPITGLNYYTYENEIHPINLIPNLEAKTTKELIEEWTKTVRELGISLVDASKTIMDETLFMPIYSNVPYDLSFIINSNRSISDYIEEQIKLSEYYKSEAFKQMGIPNELF